MNDQLLIHENTSGRFVQHELDVIVGDATFFEHGEKHFEEVDVTIAACRFQVFAVA